MRPAQLVVSVASMVATMVSACIKVSTSGISSPGFAVRADRCDLSVTTRQRALIRALDELGWQPNAPVPGSMFARSP